MKIAIISDTHDRLENIEKFVTKAEREDVSEVIHCGDICSKEVLLYLSELWRGNIHYCYGNMDQDRLSLFDVANDNKNIFSYGEKIAILEFASRKIAFQHFPEIAQNLAEDDIFDAVFYGHTHLKDKRYLGKTLLANPGNLASIKHPATFAVYDTEKNDLDFYDLE